MGINYAFAEMKQRPVVYPYFIGEYTDGSTLTEDGQTDAVFFLTGYSRTNYADLIAQARKIENRFDRHCGTIIPLQHGQMVVWYDTTQNNIPTWDEELKKLQITLHVREWSCDE